MFRKMLAIQITRKDGSTFLSSTGCGEGRAVWSPRNRKFATAHKRALREAGLKARIVKVLYRDPEVIP